MTCTGNDDIMNAMMEQETESGVDFSFDLLRYVNGEVDDSLIWSENNSVKYSEAESAIDPQLITQIVLSPPPASTSSAPLIIKGDIAVHNNTVTISNSEERNPFEVTTSSSSSVGSEQHNPWGEESSTSEYSRTPSRNLSPFTSNNNNEFESSYQNRGLSVLSNGVNCGNNVSNANYNYNIHHQQQPEHHRQTGGGGGVPPMITNGNGDYLPSSVATTSWTDRQMSNGLIGPGSKMDGGLNSGGTSTSASDSHPHHHQQQQQQHHGFHPNSFVNGGSSSAAFNLQQLHQGICSVGTVPSWQQSFSFADCVSTNVPSQIDEGNDTIPMPLSMSTIPTSSSSPNSNNITNNNNNTNHVLSNGHGSTSSGNGSHFHNHGFLDRNHAHLNGQQGTSSNQFNNTGSSYRNDNSRQSSSSSPLSLNPPQQKQMDSMSVCSDSLTLSFSASLLNGHGRGTSSVPPSPQHSPLPFVTSPSPRAESTAYNSSSEYVKMATPTRNVRLRTNTKLDMDRQKAQEEDRRDRELRQQQQQKAALQATAAVPVALPPAVNVVVPSKVLQVTSALENPTPFHVEQTRRLKIRQYCAGIANSLPEAQGTSAGLPLRPPAKLSRVQHLITDGTVSSAPPNYSTTPLSPISVVEPAAASSPGPSQRSSVATSANDEFEESFLDLILTDEKTGDQVASLPQTGFSRVSGIPEGSSSCPADSTKDGVNEDPVRVTKDRIKKDNHNKIERKRRFHINDMITEQGRLLPKANERHHERIGEVKQNKGSILKASVDYTRVLKQDNEELHLRLQKAEQEKKELLLRLQRVEQLCKQSGVQIPDDIITWKTGTTPEELSNLMTPDVRIKQEPTYSADDYDRNICDMMDDDRNIVTGSTDPMFGQVEADDGFHHAEGMDFND